MINDSELAQRLIGAIKSQQTETAQAAMLRPAETDFLRGVQAGKYQGLEIAHNMLLDILEDVNQKEIRS